MITRISEESTPKQIYLKARRLYERRILLVLFLIPLYIITSKYAGIEIQTVALIFMAVIAILNRPYGILYRSKHLAYQLLIASVLIDFAVATLCFHFFGSQDTFILITVYIIILFYCALNLPRMVLFLAATLSSILYVGFIFINHMGLTNATPIPAGDLNLLQQSFIALRHVLFFFLIAFFADKLITQSEEKDDKIFNFVYDLKQSTEHIKKLQDFQNRYFASLSHDLRTPLNSIINFSELLREKIAGQLDDQSKTFLNKIQTNAKYLHELVNDVLDMSKLRNQKMTLEMRTMNLNQALSSAMDLFTSDVLTKSITLSISETPKEDLFIRGDELKIKQILYNLISNAVKFTPENGEITLSLETLETRAVIKIRDTGSGIQKEDQDRIFKPYEQSSSTPAKVAAAGTGLGLAITRELVELHHGTIAVESELGKGSTFIIALPLKS